MMMMMMFKLNAVWNWEIIIIIILWNWTLSETKYDGPLYLLTNILLVLLCLLTAWLVSVGITGQLRERSTVCLEAIRRSTTETISRLLRNPEVLYRVRQSQPPSPVLPSIELCPELL